MEFGEVFSHNLARKTRLHGQRSTNIQNSTGSTHWSNPTALAVSHRNPEEIDVHSLNGQSQSCSIEIFVFFLIFSFLEDMERAEPISITTANVIDKPANQPVSWVGQGGSKAKANFYTRRICYLLSHSKSLAFPLFYSKELIQSNLQLGKVVGQTSQGYSRLSLPNKWNPTTVLMPA